VPPVLTHQPFPVVESFHVLPCEILRNPLSVSTFLPSTPGAVFFRARFFLAISLLPQLLFFISFREQYLEALFPFPPAPYRYDFPEGIPMSVCHVLFFPLFPDLVFEQKRFHRGIGSLALLLHRSLWKYLFYVFGFGFFFFREGEGARGAVPPPHTFFSYDQSPFFPPKRCQLWRPYIRASVCQAVSLSLPVRPLRVSRFFDFGSGAPFVRHDALLTRVVYAETDLLLCSGNC